MKKIFVTAMLTLAFSAGQVLSVNAEELNRDDALKAYKQVLANGEAANKVLSDTAQLRTVIDNKPVKLGNTVVKSAVKVWFEILNADRQPTGKLVDPSEYKWSRSEPFRIVFESAEPVAMTLSQTESGKTVTISPDKDYPETETIIPAGKRFVFPINFRTDDNNADEHLGLLLVRADATQQDIETVDSTVQNGQDSPIIIIEEIDGQDNIKNQDAVQALLAGCSGKLAKMSEGDAQLAAKCWRFRPKQIVQTVPVKQSVASDEAATVVIGAGKITYLNIVLHKK
ncbi:hypothetical protein FACS1894170_05650 [Planctomycetales bacterium]|nr:hypothetical protein FACS1894170_05650 [Planctomycetales bacterium]